MKKILVLLVATIFFSFSLCALTPSLDGDEGDPEEIIVQQNNNEGPTSINGVVCVRAFKMDEDVTVTVSGYIGPVSVLIFGGGHATSLQTESNGQTNIIIDVSSFPKETFCNLCILTNVLYQGSFLK